MGRGALAICMIAAAVPGIAADSGPLLTNSRAPYVHRLTLYDAEGKAIAPSKGESAPFSMAQTCAKCHDVGTVGGGWHFNAMRAGIPAGRPGEPWILADPATGTQLPLSYRPWKGVHHPETLGLTRAGFLERFGRHFPGGDDGTTSPSGGLETDCLACHSTDPGYDLFARAKAVQAGKFVGAAITTSHLGKVTDDSGDGANASGRKADPFAEFDPAREEKAGKWVATVAYDKTLFDADDRVLLPMTRKGRDANCLACHSTHHPGADPTANNWKRDADIHSAAGLSCADCHRNGLDHAMVRGFEGESGDPMAASLTCRGCHYGPDSAPSGKAPLAGRMGSPLPGHAGIPPLHFDILSCTSCHSGPWPGEKPGSVQTAMGHGLGIPEFGRLKESLPDIVEPVFLKGADGKLAPHRMMWPAFWARVAAEGAVTPIPPVEVLASGGAVFSSRTGDRGTTRPLSRREIAEALRAMAALAPGGGGVGYVAGGSLWRLDPAGRELVAGKSQAAEPCAWPLAHDVRPAAQSLGVRGCADCHSAGSPFFFATVTATGPVEASLRQATPMHRLAGVDPVLQGMWARAFLGRPAFKWGMAGVLALLGISILAALLRGMVPRANKGDKL